MSNLDMQVLCCEHDDLKPQTRWPENSTGNSEFVQHGGCALHETATINGSAIHMLSGKFTVGGIDMVCTLSHISKYARM